MYWNLQLGQCENARGMDSCARHSSRHARCTNCDVPAQRQGAIMPSALPVSKQNRHVAAASCSWSIVCTRQLTSRRRRNFPGITWSFRRRLILMNFYYWHPQSVHISGTKVLVVQKSNKTKCGATCSFARNGFVSEVSPEIASKACWQDGVHCGSAPGSRQFKAVRHRCASAAWPVVCRAADVRGNVPGATTAPPAPRLADDGALTLCAGCAGPPCSQPRWYSLPWHWWSCPTLARRRSRSSPCPPSVSNRGLVACGCGVHAPWRSRRNIRPAGCTVRRLARLLYAQQMVVTVRACVRRSRWSSQYVRACAGAAGR
jgi:hypothetical protein